MKLLGDVSEKDKKLASDLEQLEAEISDDPRFPKEQLAKMYVCLAHDWYQLNCEEDGNRLLEKADSVFPGYFSKIMIKHCQEDKNFDHLVRNLSVEILYILVSRLREVGK